ncbi:hypothetical protein [Lacinutrix mariniflava]|uniref:hypothetical protein n=1 Tax=Lacinutrix mariniflava TaxID=342955 RepID=UPI0006E25AC9|nr:hypothetical protein [Lacinutrix mariniflava]
MLNDLDLFSSTALIKQIEDYKKVLEDATSSDGLSKIITKDFLEVVTYYQAVANQEFKHVEDNTEVNKQDVYLLHYAISEHFKDLFLLHRDVLLQLQIAANKKTEALVNDTDLELHFNNSKALLLKATVFNIKRIIEENDAINAVKYPKKLINSIKHKKNAWPIYNQQFEDIKAQLKDITKSNLPIQKAIQSFSSIRKHTVATVLENTEASAKLKSLMGEAIKSISKMETTSEIPELISWIDRSIIEREHNNDAQTNFTVILEDKTKPLSSAIFPIATENGTLLTRQIDFNKNVKKWFDYEIIPLFIDLWEQKTTMGSFFNHSLLNLKSSLLVEKTNDSLEAVSSQLKTLKSAHQTLTKNDVEITKIADEISAKIDTKFLATHLYNNDAFLEVSIQSSLSQFAYSHGNFFTNARKSIAKKIASFNSKYENGALFSNQSIIDQSIACISYRMFKEANAHYDTLFLNKNFIGDLFIIPRALLEADFVKAKTDWDNGFNKAIVLNGKPLSGKSTFLEFVSQKYFKKNTVFLTINSTISFKGRKFKTTNNLQEALLNIKKNLSGERPLLVIDALELWQDSTHTLLENTRALLKFIESESNNVLVIISLSKHMQNLLDQRLPFSKGFSTTITTNKASFEEIYKALLLRHGASHKILVSDKKETLSKKEIEKQVAKLTRECGYNIGQVLQSWTYGTTMIEENQVQYLNKNLQFRDFFSLEEIIVLKFIFLNKEINELQLKSFVGLQFENTYKSSLKRLTNLKVLLRNQDAQLYINPVLINDIKDILIYRGTLS